MAERRQEQGILRLPWFVLKQDAACRFRILDPRALCTFCSFRGKAFRQYHSHCPRGTAMSKRCSAKVNSSKSAENGPYRMIQRGQYASQDDKDCSYDCMASV
eukprot:554889-Hanusia_phi.AAC.12